MNFLNCCEWIVCVSILHIKYSSTCRPPSAQELKPLSIIQVEVMQCLKKEVGGKKEKKKNPLPSVAASYYMSEDSLSLTSSTADNPQIIGSYFIISCRSPPRLSSPWWLSDMCRESEEESERYRRSRRHTGWKEGTVCVTEVAWASAVRENTELILLSQYDCGQKMSSHEHLSHPE